jgi:lysophospholipase L1-like esterase
MRLKTRTKALLIGLGITVALVGLAEIVLRVSGFENPPPEVPIVVWNPDEDKLMSTDDYLFEHDAHALWGLRPGAVVQFAEREKIDGPPEHVNADGFRGPLLPKPRTPGVLRIATLGDSSTFGIGVHFAETWSAQLAQRLEAAGTKAEVLDGGVDGYTVRQGLQRYRYKVRPYHPDVVIAAFGAVNEHWYSEDTDEAKIARSSEETPLVERISRGLRRDSRVVQSLAWLADRHATERFMREADKRRQVAQYLAQFAGKPDWPFERRVTVDEFKAVYATLKSEVEADGARLIIVAMPRRPQAEEQFPVLREYTRAVFAVASQHNLQLLSAHARFRYAEREKEPEPSWFLYDYWHPSATGHAKMADWLAPMVLDRTRNLSRDVEIDQLK